MAITENWNFQTQCLFSLSNVPKPCSNTKNNVANIAFSFLKMGQKLPEDIRTVNTNINRQDSSVSKFTLNFHNSIYDHFQDCYFYTHKCVNLPSWTVGHPSSQCNDQNLKSYTKERILMLIITITFQSQAIYLAILAGLVWWRYYPRLSHAVIFG